MKRKPVEPVRYASISFTELSSWTHFGPIEMPIGEIIPEVKKRKSFWGKVLDIVEWFKMLKHRKKGRCVITRDEWPEFISIRKLFMGSEMRKKLDENIFEEDK